MIERCLRSIDLRWNRQLLKDSLTRIIHYYFNSSARVHTTPKELKEKKNDLWRITRQKSNISLLNDLNLVFRSYVSLQTDWAFTSISLIIVQKKNPEHIHTVIHSNSQHKKKPNDTV